MSTHAIVPPEGGTTRRAHGAALLVLVVATALLLASSTPAFAQTVVVEGADGNVWDPDELEVAAGTVVTFDMTGGDGGHDVAIDGEEAIPFTLVGQSADYTFEAEGEYDVVCTLHPGMEMTVTVAGDGADLEDGAPQEDAPEEDAPEEDAPEDDAPTDDAPDDDASEDVEPIAADVDPDEGGGDTVLLLAVIVAVVLMFASFGLIRRQGS